MTNSLRDQLMGLGFKPAPKPERQAPPKTERREPSSRDDTHGKRDAAARPARHAPSGRDKRGPRPEVRASRPARSSSEMDLAKAYAIRAQREKDERIAAERLRQEEAQRRREGKAKLGELLKGASRNDPQAEIARHFEYGGKIRRIYVTAEQLRALNAGELDVVQLAGRYHLVLPAHADEAEALLSGALALRVDPTADATGDEYADPRFQVPDDLVW